MKKLYFECNSGISGDMTVAALLDLGADREVLCRALESLHLDGFRIEIGKAIKCGIAATDFHVILESGEEHHHAAGGHTHRRIREIFEILDRAALSERARSIAKHIFTVLAEAEGRVHGKPPEEVHFHEVGAVDSVVDIVGTAVCLDNLGFERLLCSPLTEGCGHVHCQHGTMPVPVPATLELARFAGIPLRMTETVGEMVTPTGAAIVAALSEGYTLPEQAHILGIGLGAGKKDFPHANILRVMLLETEEPDAYTDKVVCLETAVDDSTPEVLSYTMEALFSAGALDVCFSPVQMKKNRPGTLLTVLCMPKSERIMTEIIFRETSSIGLRRSCVTRTKMKREAGQVEISEGTVTVKRCVYHDIVKCEVEYESAKALAEQCGVSLRHIYQSVQAKLL